MIVDRLFQVEKTEDLVVPSVAEPTRQLSQVEENAVYYAAGYVIVKALL